MKGIVLVDLSGLVTPADLTRIAAALERQLVEHWGPMWQREGCAVTVATEAPYGWGCLTLFADSDQAGALGYHTYAPMLGVWGRVFVRPILDGGGSILSGPLSVSSVCSHEALELMTDPYATWWGDSPREDGEIALEVGDPVQDRGYPIGDVWVSDFVGPRWFRFGEGPYSYMGWAGIAPDLSGPGERTPGGYRILRSMGGSTQDFGETMPQWQRDAKAHPLARSARRC